MANLDVANVAASIDGVQNMDPPSTSGSVGVANKSKQLYGDTKKDKIIYIVLL